MNVLIAKPYLNAKSYNLDNILTIDGVSGVGKGTIAKIISNAKNWNLLDSGAIYRALALSIIENKVNLNDVLTLKNLANNLNLTFTNDKIILHGKDVSTKLRLETTGNLASELAAIPEIRAELLLKQRAFFNGKGLVADGRDMGTVVFPNAKYKIFLTASSEIRAKRRAKQLQVDCDAGKIYKIMLNIDERDQRDINRIHSPLIASKDALTIDTTNKTIENVINIINNYIKGLQD